MTSLFIEEGQLFLWLGRKIDVETRDLAIEVYILYTELTDMKLVIQHQDPSRPLPVLSSITM